jgi:P-type Ca2+ transporter type 2C
MGRRGTDLAKEAADLVLEDDRLPTIGAAIEEGRVILDNIRKFVFYLFSCNLAEILVLLAAGLAGLPAPLLPLQILWLNLLTDTFPALALALEPPEPGIMRQPPRDPKAAILSGAMVRETLAYAAVISCSALSAFVWGRAGGGDPARATTLAFVTLALAQIFHLGNARSVLPVITIQRVLANPHAVVAVGLSIGLLVLAFHVPILSEVLDLHPLSGRDWLVISGLGLVPAITGQTVKWLRARWR